MDTDWRNDIVDQILKIDFFEIRKYFKLNWCDAIISKQKNIWRYIKKFFVVLAANNVLWLADDWPMPVCEDVNRERQSIIPNFWAYH